MISASWPVLHPADDLLHDVGALGGFDHQRQLHGRRAQFHRRPGIGILGAIDDQRPGHQVVQVRGAKAEAVAGHACDERGAGFVARVVELPAAGIAAEMLGILGGEEGALVMVEPPGEARIAGIFEVYDGVFIAIEQAGIEHLGCLVGHSRVAELSIGVDRPGNEAAEIGSGRCAVKAMVVIQHAFQHE